MRWACFFSGWSSICGQFQSPGESVKHTDAQKPPVPGGMGSLSLEWAPGIASPFNSQVIRHCSHRGEAALKGTQN